jgi:phage shock protein A
MLALNYLFFFIAIFSAWIVLEIFVRLMIQKLSKDASQGKSSKQGETLASSPDPQEEAYRADKDMLEALSHIRMAVAQAIATEKQLEAQQKKNVELAEAWKNREEMAISQGNKELSDQASRRKNEYSTAALSLGAQLAKVSGAVQKLRDNLTRVENDVARFHAKMDSLKARQGAADASVKFNKHFADLLVLYSANQNMAFTAPAFLQVTKNGHPQT